jgi:hypothetical protein
MHLYNTLVSRREKRGRAIELRIWPCRTRVPFFDQKIRYERSRGGAKITFFIFRKKACLAAVGGVAKNGVATQIST